MHCLRGYILLLLSLFVLATGCGQGSSDAGTQSTELKIINGVAKNEAFPEVSQILINRDGNRWSSCTGTFIGATKLLTAAHCVTNSDGSVVADNAVVALATSADELHFHDSIRVDVHPGFVAGNWVESETIPQLRANAFDVAVVTFQQAYLGTPAMVSSRAPLIGEMLILVGFGAQTMGLTQPDEGAIGLTAVEALDEYRIYWIFDGDGEANTCFGDSGGPAFVDYGGQRLLVGVTSGGTSRTCGIGDIAFDMRVDTVLDWIVLVAEGDLYEG